MPNPLNRRTGQQWDSCSRCGFLFPVGELSVQKGLLVCSRDRDDLSREDAVRQRVIEQTLSAGQNEESTDMREVDSAFFSRSEDLEV